MCTQPPILCCEADMVSGRVFRIRRDTHRENTSGLPEECCRPRRLGFASPPAYRNPRRFYAPIIVHRIPQLTAGTQRMPRHEDASRDFVCQKAGTGSERKGSGSTVLYLYNAHLFGPLSHFSARFLPPLIVPGVKYLLFQVQIRSAKGHGGCRLFPPGGSTYSVKDQIFLHGYTPTEAQEVPENWV